MVTVTAIIVALKCVVDTSVTKSITQVVMISNITYRANTITTVVATLRNSKAICSIMKNILANSISYKKRKVCIAVGVQ